MKDQIEMEAQKIIELVSKYFEEEYELKPKPRLAKENWVEPSLVYGEDYYILEELITKRIENFINRKASELLHRKLKDGGRPNVSKKQK